MLNEKFLLLSGCSTALKDSQLKWHQIDERVDVSTAQFYLDTNGLHNLGWKASGIHLEVSIMVSVRLGSWLLAIASQPPELRTWLKAAAFCMFSFLYSDEWHGSSNRWYRCSLQGHASTLVIHYGNYVISPDKISIPIVWPLRLSPVSWRWQHKRKHIQTSTGTSRGAECLLGLYLSINESRKIEINEPTPPWWLPHLGWCEHSAVVDFILSIWTQPRGAPWGPH